MTDQELRVLVREAIAQQLGQVRSGNPGMVPATFLRDHLSHAQFSVPSGPDGRCIIEPSVMCNHCGYCKSYGH
jgi:hypothetical protein